MNINSRYSNKATYEKVYISKEYTYSNIDNYIQKKGIVSSSDKRKQREAEAALRRQKFKENKSSLYLGEI